MNSLVQQNNVECKNILRVRNFNIGLPFCCRNLENDSPCVFV